MMSSPKPPMSPPAIVPRFDVAGTGLAVDVEDDDVDARFCLDQLMAKSAEL